MKIGVTIFDNNPKHTLEQKVEFAALRCYQRTGKRPTVCHINEADKNGVDQIGDIRLEVSRYCGKHNYFVGVE